MDTLTHALLGVTLCEATFRRRIGRSANWLAAAAAALPDIDTWLNFAGDPWATMEFHRGATHSLLVAPLLAGLVAGVFWLFRRRQFGAMYLLALLAGVSHLLLDLATSYGTQLFWPINHTRFQFDILPIVDVIFTPMLILTIFACWRVRRRLGRSSAAAPGRPVGGLTGALQPGGVARVGLAIAGLYVCVGIWADVRAHQIALATVPKEQGAVLAVRAGPLIGTTFARRLVVETADGFYVARLNLLLTPGEPHWRWAPNDNESSFVKQAESLDRIKLFRWFADGMVRSKVEITSGKPWLARVTFYDMRYGYPADSERSIFAAYVIFDAVTRRVVEGPTHPGWTAGDSTLDGAAAYFQPIISPMVEPGGNWWSRIWERIELLWDEAWRP